MRPTLSRLLIAAAKADPKVMVLTGDHGYALFADYRQECPSQFLNCGIAEQNMIGVAAGLARQGFKPIVYALAAFMPTRTVEQIKLDLCYPNLPVTLIGDGAGLAYTNLGPTHHACEDVALLRSLPGISILSPADRHGLERCFKAALDNDGPTYLRLGKGDLGDVPLAGSVFKEGSDPEIVVFTTGPISKLAYEAVSRIRDCDIVLVEQIKPFDAEAIIAACEGKHYAVTIEEHYEAGGLGSAVAEVLASVDAPIPVLLRLGVPDRFVEMCGSWEYLIKQAGLDVESIVKRIGDVVQ